MFMERAESVRVTIRRHRIPTTASDRGCVKTFRAAGEPKNALRSRGRRYVSVRIADANRPESRSRKMGSTFSHSLDPKRKLPKALLIDISPRFRHDPAAGGINNNDVLHRRASAPQCVARRRRVPRGRVVVDPGRPDVFPAFGLGATAVRRVIVVLVIGLLPVLIFAWAFEITPDGLKRENEVDRSQSITPQTGKKLDRVIMGVLALALGYFAVDKFVLAPQREQAATEAGRAEGRTESLVKSYGDKSIAVLPFVNMSADKDQEYFSDGISEELLNLLAKIPKLRVISRSSAFSYKGKDVKLAQVAEELNVAHILEGSVRKAGNKVRITAQLIEARSDTHLWSNTWDRELDDIFAVQDEIAAAVVEQLKITLLGEAPKAKEVNPEAYALFLQGRQLRRQNTPEAL